MMYRKIILPAVLLAGAALLLPLKRNRDEVMPTNPGSGPSAVQVRPPVLESGTRSSAAGGALSAVAVESPADEQKILEAMRDHLDEGENALALEAARKLVKHEERLIRLEALQAMHWIGGPAAYDVTAFFDDSDNEICTYARQVFDEALDDLDNPDLEVTLLAASLESSVKSVRYTAVEDLVFLPEHLSFKPLASALNDADAEVRELARENLEFIAEEEFSTEAEALVWFAENEALLKRLNTAP